MGKPIVGSRYLSLQRYSSHYITNVKYITQEVIVSNWHYAPVCRSVTTHVVWRWHTAYIHVYKLCQAGYAFGACVLATLVSSHWVSLSLWLLLLLDVQMHKSWDEKSFFSISFLYSYLCLFIMANIHHMFIDLSFSCFWPSLTCLAGSCAGCHFILHNCV